MCGLVTTRFTLRQCGKFAALLEQRREWNPGVKSQRLVAQLDQHTCVGYTELKAPFPVSSFATATLTRAGLKYPQPRVCLHRGVPDRERRHVHLGRHVRQRASQIVLCRMPMPALQHPDVPESQSVIRAEILCRCA